MQTITILRMLFVFIGLLPCGMLAAGAKAKNVILFLGDAGGIPTLNAAGIYAHDRPLSLFIQGIKDIALSETSSLDDWVTDSAAGMTAIVTGQKTNNGMLSRLPGTGKERSLKTILEYAEERGLATGVVTNMPVWDATPAACYAHVDSRSKAGEIIAQLLHPRFGDGVDIIIGADRKGAMAATHNMGFELDSALRGAHYTVLSDPSALDAGMARAAAIYDGGDFAPEPVVANVIRSLARNPRGFFLMVEWDMHTYKTQLGLDRALVMDALIRKTAAEAPPDTLIIYTADHSFDLRLRGGKKSEPLAGQMKAAAELPPVRAALAKPVLRVENGHTGEEVLVAALGPGAGRLRGFMPNTGIFHFMMETYGWSEDSPAVAAPIAK